MKPYTSSRSWALLLALTTLTPACSRWEGEVVESQYQAPLVPDPTYTFQRQGTSSVDLLLPQQAASASETLYSRFLRTAYILNGARWQELKQLFAQGGNNEIALEPLIASSAQQGKYRSAILSDFTETLDDVRRAAGYDGDTYATERYNRRASAGQAGFIGYNQGDNDRFFVTPDGFAPSEVYRGMTLGAVYLDKALGEYLDEKFLTDKTLIQAHEAPQLVPGRSYTALEHTWDLAYGYYLQAQKLLQSNSLTGLKGSETKLFNAFALGRLAITEYRYEEALSHLRSIRTLLAQAVAARAIEELVGRNTLANLNERPEDAFRFVSRGVGYLYALQFTRRPSGEPYLSHEEVKRLIASLRAGEGLWESSLRERLDQVARSISSTFALSLPSKG